MGRARSFRLSEKARLTLADLDRLLDTRYRTPEADLDNKSDPVDEAVYIILSFQTNLSRFRRTWAHLRSAFPSWDDLVRAPLIRITRVLKQGGLQEQKARIIKGLLRAIKKRTGAFSLDMLHEKNDDDAERILTQFPGVSWKAARCVLLYSLDRAVFPVDGNTFRVLKRIGVLPASAVYRRRSLHDGLQLAVPPSRRKAFHVNLVVHGQRVCLPRHPECSICVARSVCSMNGVPPEIKAEARRQRRERPESAREARNVAPA